VERDGPEAANQYMSQLGLSGGTASWKARVERDGPEAANLYMSQQAIASIGVRCDAHCTLQED